MNEFVYNSYKLNINKNINKLGTKFSWSEEFIPSLINNNKNLKVIYIVRDLRLLINSAINYNKNKYRSSSVRPINYYIRYWKKSYYIINFLKNNLKYNKNILILKYEDLLKNQNKETKKLFNFIDINNSVKINHLCDQFGRKWLGNSSFKNFKTNKISNNNKNSLKYMNINLVNALTTIAYDELINLKYQIPKNFNKLNLNDAYNIINLYDKNNISKKMNSEMRKKYKEFFISHKNLNTLIIKEEIYNNNLKRLCR